MSASRQLVVCALGAERYGLPIERVREIVRWVEPRPVAADGDGLRGVIGLRGRLLPVHDLAALLGLPRADGAAAPPPSAKIVVVETDDEPAGLVVDDVVEVRTVDGELIEELAAPSFDGRPAEIAKLGERLVLLLDPVALLSAAGVAAA